MRLRAEDAEGLLQAGLKAFRRLACAGITAKLKSSKAVTLSLRAQGADSGDLVAAFLNDLLFLAETQRLYPGRFTGHVLSAPGGLRAEGLLTGRRLAEGQSPLAVEIKNITRHQAQTKTTAQGLTLDLIWDV